MTITPSCSRMFGALNGTLHPQLNRDSLHSGSNVSALASIFAFCMVVVAKQMCKHIDGNGTKTGQLRI